MNVNQVGRISSAPDVMALAAAIDPWAFKEGAVYEEAARRPAKAASAAVRVKNRKRAARKRAVQVLATLREQGYVLVGPGDDSCLN